jgi:hypothetical protein
VDSAAFGGGILRRAGRGLAAPAPLAYLRLGPGKRRMKTARISSRCECQARLFADLDEHRYVLKGWAVDRERDLERVAPAQSIGAGRSVFDVSWSCPFCIRTTLRSFTASGLAFREAGEAAPPAI